MFRPNFCILLRPTSDMDMANEVSAFFGRTASMVALADVPPYRPAAFLPPPSGGGRKVGRPCTFHNSDFPKKQKPRFLFFPPICASRFKPGDALAAGTACGPFAEATAHVAPPLTAHRAAERELRRSTHGNSLPLICPRREFLYKEFRELKSPEKTKTTLFVFSPNLRFAL